VYLRELGTASHPLSGLTVTAVAAFLSIKAGNTAAITLIMIVAVLSGQLLIGWSNDRIDFDDDRRTDRRDKPLVTGDLPLGAIETAIFVAFVITVPTSLFLGWRAGVVHLGAVGCAVAYSAWLKHTAIWWLPYPVVFALLPAVATLALPNPAWPSPWVVAVTVLVGTAAAAVPDRVVSRRPLVFAAAALYVIVLAAIPGSLH
jgi:4-hydroxybenzoate polyprenyltransferase